MDGSGASTLSKVACAKGQQTMARKLGEELKENILQSTEHRGRM